ncbi:hypothetical protein Tco_1337556 [Tanacetum coccineum]
MPGIRYDPKCWLGHSTVTRVKVERVDELIVQNLLSTSVAQVGSQGRGQGSDKNQNGDAINDHIRGDVGMPLKAMIVGVVLIRNSVACNPKVSMMEDSQRVRYTAGSVVSKALTWWNLEIRTRGREAAIGMVAATEPKTIQKAVQLAGTLTDEALRNGLIKKNPKKRGNVGEPSKDRNGREDNKRTRTGNAFAMTETLLEEVTRKDEAIEMSAKQKEKNNKEIVVSERFSQVAKSPYRLAPFELEELSGQLRTP